MQREECNKIVCGTGASLFPQFLPHRLPPSPQCRMDTDAVEDVFINGRHRGNVGEKKNEIFGQTSANFRNFDRPEIMSV